MKCNILTLNVGGTKAGGASPLMLSLSISFASTMLLSLHVIYNTQGRVFHQVSKHQNVGWKTRQWPSRKIDEARVDR